jgi:lipoprotein-anchoring transpeptidase ErfK/SrfK
MTRDLKRVASSTASLAVLGAVVIVLVLIADLIVATGRDAGGHQGRDARPRLLQPQAAVVSDAATAPAVLAPAATHATPRRAARAAAAAHQPAPAHHQATQTTATTSVALRAASHDAPARDVRLIPKVTYLAALQHSTAGYRTAHAKHRSMRVPKAWYGRTSVLPILKAAAGRVKVRLARRPNESSTWIKLGAALFSQSKSAILIDLSQRRLYVFKSGRQKFSFPIGEGTSRTPTPTGKFFVAFHAPPNAPEYGDVMLETSAHSEVFRTFGGGNDAIIAIHGPINSDRQIGNNGARISNGCIRMHNSQLVKVAKVQDGTPVIITH